MMHIGNIPEYLWDVTLYLRPVIDKDVQLQKVDKFIVIGFGPKSALEYCMNYLREEEVYLDFILDEVEIKRKSVHDDTLVVLHKNLV